MPATVALGVASALAGATESIPSCRLDRAEYDAVPEVASVRANAAVTVDRLRAELSEKTERLGAEHVEVASTLFRLGVAYRQAQRFSDARTAYEQVLAIRATAQPIDDNALGLVELNLGITHRFLGQPHAAIDVLTRLITRRESHGSGRDRTQALAFTTLAWARLDAMEIPAGLQDAERAIEINRAVLRRDDPAHGDALNVRGHLSRRVRQYSQSIEDHQTAIGLARVDVRRSYGNLANGFTGLGGTLGAQGHFADAKRCHELALAIREKAFGRNSQGVFVSHQGLAATAFAMGRYAEAKRHAESALEAIRPIAGSENEFVAQNLLGLGRLYRAMNDLATARRLFEQSLAMRERQFGAHHQSVEQPLLEIASTMIDPSARAAALQIHRRVLVMRQARLGPIHRLVGASLAEIAIALADTGADVEARSAFERALAIYEEANRSTEIGLARVLVRQGQLLQRLGQPELARKALDHALAIVGTRGFHPHESWYVLDAYSRSLRGGGDRDTAIYFAKLAVNGIQMLREGMLALDEGDQQSFLVDKLDVYRNLADLLIAEGRLGEALDVMRMLKHEEFFEFIQRDARSDRRASAVPLTLEERQVRLRVEQSFADAIKAAAELERLAHKARVEQRLSSEEEHRRAQLQGVLAGARNAFQRYLADLPASLRPTSRASTSPSVGQLDGLRQELRKRPRTAILHYVMGPERLSIILTLPGIHVPIQVAVSDETLYREVVELLRVIASKTDVRPAAQQLYSRLIAPIEKELAAADLDTLLLSLDGALRYVPFSALFDGERHLVERYAIAILTEATKVRGLTNVNADPSRIGAMGVSKGSAKLNMKPLPAVREELWQIVAEGSRKGLIPGRTLLDEAFTSASLRELAERDFSLLHVATHFQFMPGSERESFLLLGNDEKLTLEQLRHMDLPLGHVDLLTLSACQTALTDARSARGSEVEGLGVLLLNQGARNVVATLWQVADSSTSQLMVEFYRMRSQSPQVAKAHALRIAQLALLRGAPHSADAKRGGSSFAHPYHWAPFVLMGSGL